jgi:hypothetical protein
LGCEREQERNKSLFLVPLMAETKLKQLGSYKADEVQKEIEKCYKKA